MDLASFAGVEKDAVSILDARDVLSSGSRRLFQTETIEVDYTIRYSSQSTAEDAAAVIEDVEELPEVEEYLSSNSFSDVGYDLSIPTVIEIDGAEGGGNNLLSTEGIIGVAAGGGIFLLALGAFVMMRLKKEGGGRSNSGSFKFYYNPQNEILAQSQQAMAMSESPSYITPQSGSDYQMTVKNASYGISDDIDATLPSGVV